MEGNIMIKILGYEKDINENLLEIKHDDTVLTPSIYAFYLTHYAELIISGFAPPISKIDFTHCRIVYAEKNDIIIGAIFYDCQWVEERKYATIALSAVGLISPNV
jgi:hypothetical protein